MPTPFEPSGVITLTTDFGHKGPFVGTMKGAMLTRHPRVYVVDITHETDVHFPAEAGFWLARSFPYFPKGTVHVAVVEPGEGTGRDIIVLALDGHLFVAPDNGLLAPLAEREGAVVRAVDLDRIDSIDLDAASATFHGRDIFAPLAAELASGRLAFGKVGPKVDQVVPSWVDDPAVERGRIRGSVIAVDNFGNLISNIDGALLEGMEEPMVRAAGRTLPLKRTYTAAQPGELLALVNSFGVVEVARSGRSAADTLGLERGAPIVVQDGA